MKKSERRVAIALVGVAIWLGGLYAAIHGLVYDKTMEFRYGALAIFVGVAIAVIAMNLISLRRSNEKKEKSAL
jgi:small neutral amino acid transporter SnatA (MarC family)